MSHKNRSTSKTLFKNIILCFLKAFFFDIQDVYQNINSSTGEEEDSGMVLENNISIINDIYSPLCVEQKYLNDNRMSQH